jgi:hypothetical protein
MEEMTPRNQQIWPPKKKWKNLLIVNTTTPRKLSLSSSNSHTHSQPN